MTAPQVRIKLPEIPSATTERPSGLIDSLNKSEWKSSIYKARPAYIAKKISNDELFGDMLKPGANIGLSQIDEEKVIETENFRSVDSEEEVDDDNQKQAQSIFKKETVVSSKYKEHGKGPAYTKAGHIVKHSIVGSVETYERYQRSLKKYQHRDNGSSFDKDNTKDNTRDNTSSSESASRRTFKMSSFSIAADQTLSSLAGAASPQAGSLSKRHSTFERKREAKKESRASKAEILTRVNRMRDQQLRFYELEMKKYDNLPLGDQLHHSKQKRCLEKFDKVVVHWNETVDSVNQNIKRQIGKPVMLRSDDFRRKMEQSEAFNLVQTDQERFGTTFWYMTLRKYGPDDSKDFQRVIHDIPEGFRCPQIVRSGSTLEVIRKPVKLDTTTTTLPPMNDTRSLDRTRDEYLLDRSTFLQTELSKVMPTQTAEMDTLIIEGKNKLDLEVDAFFKSSQNKDGYVIPKSFLEGKKFTQEEETLIEHYDNKEIVRNGLAAFVK